MPFEMHRGRRDVLAGLVPPSGEIHAGLWLGAFLKLQTFEKSDPPPGYDKQKATDARDGLVGQVEGRPLPKGYREAFARWKAGLEQERCVMAHGTARGRVVIGVGAKGASEIGLTLHHTWGVPVLPGSSLKGIAALGAREHLDGFEGRPDPARARPGGPTAYDALFGDVEEQGAVVFHDAWLVPPADGKNPLFRDVLTVHHPEYYQGRAALPSDTDNPTPVPFVSTKAEWLVALEIAPSLGAAEGTAWLRAAWAALRVGLERHGIGAKTNAGYGRVTLPDWDAAKQGGAP